MEELAIKVPVPVTVQVVAPILAQAPPMINRVSTVLKKMTTLTITVEHKHRHRLQPGSLRNAHSTSQPMSGLEWDEDAEEDGGNQPIQPLRRPNLPGTAAGGASASQDKSWSSIAATDQPSVYADRHSSMGQNSSPRTRGH
ncbi:hypothetical protein OS493_018326 [Desmophyllum pertusum]|uniref:Uncharacterized protein n=1 Tax=Desmophyllum pertusum TaxID=174260 RepID=A0A9W9YCA9_9CNID|nr:hypothetical protein OS493_018326 [Desmophyllum pertusum]